MLVDPKTADFRALSRRDYGLSQPARADRCDEYGCERAGGDVERCPGDGNGTGSRVPDSDAGRERNRGGYARKTVPAGGCAAGVRCLRRGRYGDRGAGAVRWLSGLEPETAVELANVAAGIVVGKVGTVPVDEA